MADYPKFTFDKSRIPDFPPEYYEKIKESAERLMQYYVPPCDPYALKTHKTPSDVIEYVYDPEMDYKNYNWTAEVQFDLTRLSEKRNMEALAIIDECKGKSLPYLLNELARKGFGGEIGCRMMLPPIIRLREKENG